MGQITGKSQKGQQIPNLTETEAREHIEKLLWPNGPCCRHCGSVNVYRMQGASIRPGLLRCRDCEQQFTVTVGTIFEDSHLPLSTWVTEREEGRERPTASTATRTRIVPNGLASRPSHPSGDEVRAAIRLP